MADEEQLRRYLATGDGSYKSLHETNQQTPAQDNANSPDWIDMLDDWWERTFGKLQKTRLLDRTSGVPLSTAHDALASASSTSEHEDELRSGSTAFWVPMENTGVPLTSQSASQESLVQGPGISGNNARASGAASDFQRNMEHHQAEHPYSYCNVCDNGSAGAQNPTSIRSDWDTVAKTSRADIVQPSATPENYSRVPPGTLTLQSNAAHGHVRMSQYGLTSVEPSASSGDDSIAPLKSMVTRLEINEESVTLVHSVRIGTGSTQTGKREDISGIYGHVNHGMITSGERRLKCELCGNSFKKKHHLATHRHVHTGDKPYHCGICGKSFVRKAHLDVHRRTHTGEKPFKCTTCTKSFAQQGNLRVHERTHTGERPYKCKMCEYSSTTSSHLKKHQRTHRNKKP